MEPSWVLIGSVRQIQGPNRSSMTTPLGGSSGSSRYPFGGPWLCVPPSRTVCPLHLRDSGTACIDMPVVEGYAFGRLSGSYKKYRRTPGASGGGASGVRRSALLRVATGLKLARAAAPRARDLVRIATETRDQLPRAAARRAGRTGVVLC